MPGTRSGLVQCADDKLCAAMEILTKTWYIDFVYKITQIRFIFFRVAFVWHRFLLRCHCTSNWWKDQKLNLFIWLGQYFCHPFSKTFKHSKVYNYLHMLVHSHIFCTCNRFSAFTFSFERHFFPYAFGSLSKRNLKLMEYCFSAACVTFCVLMSLMRSVHMHKGNSVYVKQR